MTTIEEIEDNAFILLLGQPTEQNVAGWERLVPGFEGRIQKMIRDEIAFQGSEATAQSVAHALSKSFYSAWHTVIEPKASPIDTIRAAWNKLFR